MNSPFRAAVLAAAFLALAWAAGLRVSEEEALGCPSEAGGNCGTRATSMLQLQSRTELLAEAAGLDSSREQLLALYSKVEAAVARTLGQHAAHGGRQREGAVPGRDAASVLFVVYSGAQFYTTRVRWIMETWGRDLPLANLVFIGDRPAAGPEAEAALRGATVHVTACQQNSHEEGMCCKLAEAAILASHMMQQSPGAFDWAYLVDDDVYVRPGTLTKFLALQRPPVNASGRVLGNFDCVTDACKGGLCGGSGYAADASAVPVLVGSDAAGFLSEQMQNCQKCGRWADVGLSRFFYERPLELRPLYGTYANRLRKPCFDDSLTNLEHEPLMYHYIKSESQMQFLHKLFLDSNGFSASSAPPPLLQLAARGQLCATFHGSQHCAPLTDAGDAPWDLTNDTTC